MVGTLFAATGHLTAWRDAVLVLVGVAAGLVNGVAGGGTLISFPTLLAMGYPALTANITNTVGIWPGYVSGMGGFRHEVADQRTRVRELVPVATIAAVAGSILLLTTPAAAFRRLTPWLVLAAALLYAVQPSLARLLEARAAHSTRHVVLLVGTALTAIYGGYFGAGLGVLLLAVLGIALPDTVARTSGLRLVLSAIVNGAAAVVFMVHGGVVWEVVLLLAVGSLGGGWLGALVVVRLPAMFFRIVVVGVGIATTVSLLVG